MVQVAQKEGARASPEAGLLTIVRPSEERPASALVGETNSAFPLPLQGCIERGSGSRVWDERGREYLDFLLASGPLILGHAHPAVTEAVALQLSKGSAFHALNRPAMELANRVAEVPGCAEAVRFASTGTEATLHAVRLARAYTGRDKVLVFARSYHGSHDLSLVGHRGAALAQRGGVPSGTVHDTVLARFNDIQSVERAFAAHGPSLGAVLIEPQQRSLDPAPAFLPRLTQLCRANGTILIFDEVLTGFRLAYGGAQEYYGVSPDIVCYGKILGGGFPLSAVAGRRDIMEQANPARASAHGFVHISGTLSGNPISAVAGLATLNELRRPGAYERLHELGRRLRSGLTEALDEIGVEASVIGSGPIAAIEFADSAGPGSGGRLKTAVNREMIRRGTLVQLQTRFYVSLAHTDDDVDLAVEVLASSVTAALSAQT